MAPDLSLDADPQLDAIASALAGLPLPSGALVALAEAAGAPVDAAASPRQIVEVAARLDGALGRLLALAAVAVPESAGALAALEAGLGEATGPRRRVALVSGRLGRAWTLGRRPLAWRWLQAEEALAQARGLAQGLAGDGDEVRLNRWADEVAESLADLPERRARIPGASLIRPLERWGRLSAGLYTLSQLTGRAPRLWPLVLLAVVAWLFWTAPPETEGSDVAWAGEVHGSSSADPSPQINARAVQLPPALQQSTPEAAEAPAPKRRPRDRPDPTPMADPVTSPEPAELTPPTDDPIGPQALNAGVGEGGDSAVVLSPGGGGGGGGAVSGGGSIRHTALPGVAPMPFLGVNGLPLPVEDPREGEVWVGQTEVTEDQWMALMGLDFAVLTGRADRPAEHMTWCEALDYANRLSKSERLQPVYEVPRGCNRGARPRWKEGANGYRLPTEAEWEAMVGSSPGWGVDARSVVRARAADGLGLFGIEGNAAEFVWAGDGSPVLRHRNCKVDAVEDAGRWPEGEPLPCRFEVAPGERILGGGLRLVRGAPPPQG